MKLKDGFLMKSVGGRNIVVPSGNMLKNEVMIVLNDTGCFLWKQLEKEVTRETLIAELMKKYDIEETTAAVDVDSFLEDIRKHGFLEKD